MCAEQDHCQNGDVRLLVVCTANICRSPSAAAVVRRAGLPGLQVASAGTQAAEGLPGCPAAPLLGDQAATHRSRLLTPHAVGAADLILTAERAHQTDVVALGPQARARTFTVTQAGRLAQWLLDIGMLEAAAQPGEHPPEDPRAHVTPLPPPGQRDAWLVAELDAARGLAPVPVVPADGRRWRRNAPDPPHPDDIPDPHVLGPQWHGPAAEGIAAALTPLLEVMRRLS